MSAKYQPKAKLKFTDQFGRKFESYNFFPADLKHFVNNDEITLRFERNHE